MWHWQRKNEYSYSINWVKGVFISSIGHSILGIFFMWCQQPMVALDLTIYKKKEQDRGSRVTFVMSDGAHKAKIGQETSVGNKIKDSALVSSKKTGIAKTGIIKKERVKKLGVTEKKSLSERAHLIEKNDDKAFKETVNINKNKQKKEITAPDNKPTSQKLVPKIPGPKTGEQQKKDQSMVSKKAVCPAKAVKEIKGVDTKTEDGSHKRETGKRSKASVAPIKKSETPVLASLPIPDQGHLEVTSIPEISHKTMAIEVGSDNSASLVYEQLRTELARKWQPPVGITPPKSCIMRIYASDDGSAKTIETVQSSGILMFDISVQSVCHAVCHGYTWPLWARNKPVTITFL